MSKPSLGEDNLNAGLKVMLQSGYLGASVRDICAAAGAPHGSFTNRFRSKEAFGEEVLSFPGATLRKLTEEEMTVYRAPFPTPESRRPTWRFPNEIPIAGEPADVYSSLEKAHEL